MKYKTKVQSTGGTLSTSIPKIIRDLYNLEKGDTVEWVVSIDEQGTKVTLEKSE
ncbi:AbrB/MazE/SpoVT family DNA-binding domain-containing protein [Methanobrevibacter millerae]|uniref:AbrB/MazE/SpoVT family DNA-binding domain-containing protein n=1 Tax=Methanobrevibacter millerae TaxID=230361 RepID=UPI0026F0DDF8|nr:AbrB/MazE/SpoVT family DNA-binding domain-containing protein [Methanobrevibacter millerae]